MLYLCTDLRIMVFSFTPIVAVRSEKVAKSLSPNVCLNTFICGLRFHFSHTLLENHRCLQENSHWNSHFK